jgi:asparagine synthase (glutamine-hydrolysing)
MCGVAAAVGQDAAVQVHKMIDRMAHRGVRSKVEYGEDWAVGHVRLPVVGVGEEYDQPVKNALWTLAWVGEVLDFRERNPLAGCDTDLVVRSWSEGMHQRFLAFDGFWSVVAYDSQAGGIHCLVDYLAQKPLYYRGVGKGFVVASEPDAVASVGRVDLDKIYLGACIKWGYCPEPRRTPYIGVWKTAPGDYLYLHPGYNPDVRRVDILQPAGLSIAGLREEIVRAVRRRVVSADVPVACLVSGGLDSSIVYTLAKRYGDVKPYHVENGEWGQCSKVAPESKRINLTNAPVASKCLDYIQEPIDLGSLVPQVALSDAVRAAGNEVVVLTGDGADELFGG